MNRWSEFRMFDDSIPETHYEASVFLDNAFWHARSSGADASALLLITDVMVAVRAEKAVAA